jgi:DNA-binding CsgD family transcriptional regulator
MALANDFMARKGGRMAINCAMIGCCILCPSLLLVDEIPIWISACLVVILICCLMMNWGDFLSNVKHNSLLKITWLGFLATGIALMLLQLLMPTIKTLLIISLLFLSLHCLAILTSRNSGAAWEFISKKVSKERILQVRGRRTGLAAGGFILGCAIIMILSSKTYFPYNTELFGIALIISGLVLLFFRKPGSSSFESFLHYTLAFFFIAGILLYPFVPEGWRLWLGCYLLCVALTNISIAFTAFSEIIRFNQTSSVWAIGSEAFVLILGVAVGQAALGFVIYSGNQLFIIFVCVVSAVVISGMQLITDRHTFSFLNYYIEEDATTSTPDNKPSFGLRWKDRVGIIAETYGLTARQREIMELLAKGRNVDYIMKHFYISRSTTKTHIYAMYRKLNIHTRQELLDLVENASSIKPPEQ